MFFPSLGLANKQKKRKKKITKINSDSFYTAFDKVVEAEVCPGQGPSVWGRVAAVLPNSLKRILLMAKVCHCCAASVAAAAAIISKIKAVAAEG